MKWLQETLSILTVTELVVGIGRDSRISGQDLTKEFIPGVIGFRRAVIDFERGGNGNNSEYVYGNAVQKKFNFATPNRDVSQSFTFFYYNGLNLLHA